MKRFLLFAGRDYEERGGWDDLHGRYDGPVTAFMEAHRIGVTVDWWHIVDLETDETWDKTTVDPGKMVIELSKIITEIEETQ